MAVILPAKLTFENQRIFPTALPALETKNAHRHRSARYVLPTTNAGKSEKTNARTI